MNKNCLIVDNSIICKCGVKLNLIPHMSDKKPKEFYCTACKQLYSIKWKRFKKKFVCKDLYKKYIEPTATPITQEYLTKLVSDTLFWIFIIAMLILIMIA